MTAYALKEICLYKGRNYCPSERLFQPNPQVPCITLPLFHASHVPDETVPANSDLIFTFSSPTLSNLFPPSLTRPIGLAYVVARLITCRVRGFGRLPPDAW